MLTRFDWLAACPSRRCDDEGREGPISERLSYLAAAGGAAGYTCQPSPEDALHLLRDACVEASRPRRVVGCGGDDPALVRALASLAAQRGDTLVLVPPLVSGAPAAESLWLATETPAGEAPPFVVLGAATQTGAVAALPDVLDVVDARPAEIVLDLTAAPWCQLDELDAFRPLGFLGALDRWDRRDPGSWAALALPRERGDQEPGLPPEAPREPPAHLLEIDAWLRGVLASRSAFRPWPRAGAGVSPGIITFEIEGRGAAESRMMLERSFGVIVDAGPVSAAPLPPAPGLEGEAIRVALDPEHDERSVEPLVQGLLRLAEHAELVPTLH